MVDNRFYRRKTPALRLMGIRIFSCFSWGGAKTVRFGLLGQDITQRSETTFSSKWPPQTRADCEASRSAAKGKAVRWSRCWAHVSVQPYLADQSHGL
jgi:hypothetical protein